MTHSSRIHSPASSAASARLIDQQYANEQYATDEQLAWMQLSQVPTIGPVTFRRLIQHYRDAQTAIQALPALLKKRTKQTAIEWPSIDDIREQWIHVTQKMGGWIVTQKDPRYPTALLSIEDAPPLLYGLGNLDILHQPAVAIVGSRYASIHGLKMAEKLAHEIGNKGYVIVSGLARGIDAQAHRASLSTGTVAVIAGGIDQIYPQENADLYKKIIEFGAIVAESPPGTKPHAKHFPRRNRIISGLSQGVVVVEATLKSGTMHTAHAALEQNRDVFAVPGSPMDPRSSGCNALIKQGAMMVESADDVIQTLHAKSKPMVVIRENDARIAWDQSPSHENLWADDCTANHECADAMDSDQVSCQNHRQPTTPINHLDTSGFDEALMELLSSTPVDIDDLATQLSVPVAKLQQTLLSLELSGAISRTTGNRVYLN